MAIVPWILLLCFGSSLEQVFCKQIPSYAGPYRIIIRNVHNNSDEYHSTGDYWCRLYYTHPRLTETQYSHGRCYTNRLLSDEYRAEVRVSVWANNQWKRNAFVFNFNHACSDMFFYGKCFVDVVYRANEKKCPLPAIGLREIKNQTYESIFPQFPVIPYGHYLFTMAFIRGNTTRGLVVAEGDVVPRL